MSLLHRIFIYCHLLASLLFFFFNFLPFFLLLLLFDYYSFPFFYLNRIGFHNFLFFLFSLFLPFSFLRLAQYTEDNADVFRAEARKEAERLVKASYGGILLHSIGKVYCNCAGMIIHDVGRYSSQCSVTS